VEILPQRWRELAICLDPPHIRGTVGDSGAGGRQALFPPHPDGDFVDLDYPADIRRRIDRKWRGRAAPAAVGARAPRAPPRPPPPNRPPRPAPPPGPPPRPRSGC